MPNSLKISVLVVDDHTVVRHGLKSLLESEGDIQVVGEAKDGAEAVRKAKSLKPNVVLLDVAMPVMHGIETARQLSRTVPDSKVLILSSYSEPQEIDRALEAGASGYLMKETASSEVLRAVRDAYRGKAYFSSAISQRMLQQNRIAFSRGKQPRTHAPKLTERERQTLELISKGRANKQIADELGISIKTVEKHRASVMEKLNIHEAAGLTRYAIASGLIETKGPALARAPEK
jgi:DNA-binding NarL/FixJ family response regulator